MPPHRGDYWDCLEKRKAQLLLISFEAGLGGMSPFAARRLRRLARMAKESGADPTDYTISATARSFVPYHAQRLSSVCVMYGAGAIQKSIKKLMADRRRSAAGRPCKGAHAPLPMRGRSGPRAPWHIPALRIDGPVVPRL